MKPSAWVLLVCALHLVLAFAFAWVAPYRKAGINDGLLMPDIGAPDEVAHVQYVQHLLDGKGIPSPVGFPNIATYEAHQPPAYYLLAAGWARLGGFQQLDSRVAGLWLRLLNALLGSLAVAGAFCFALWAYSRLDLAVGVAAFVALLPMNVALSGAVSNDPLVICAAAWLLATLVHALAFGWSWKKAMAAGLLVGVSLATKTSSVSLIVPLVLGLALGRAKRAWWVLALVVALAIPAPVWVRNWVLYQDPIMLRNFEIISAKDAIDWRVLGSQPVEVARLVVIDLQYTMRSFVGLFGYAAIEYPFWVYTAMLLLLGGAVLGWVRRVKPARGTLAAKTETLALWFLAAVMVLYIRWNLGHYQPQARYVFAALPVFGLVFVGGLQRLWGRRRGSPVAGLLILLLALDIWALPLMDAKFKEMQDQYKPPLETSHFGP